MLEPLFRILALLTAADYLRMGFAITFFNQRNTGAALAVVGFALGQVAVFAGLAGEVTTCALRLRFLAGVR